MGKLKYTVTASSDYNTFHFVSTSSEKTISKRIEYDDSYWKLEGKWVYNLAFGDVDENGNINDESQSNNKDILTVMSTVISTVYEYTKQYPERCVYFKGSDKQRTEFYKTIIIRQYSSLIEDFYIYGIKEEENDSIYELFDKDGQYVSFAVIRKLKDEEELG